MGRARNKARMDDRPVPLSFLGPASEIETLNPDTDCVSERRAIDDVRDYRLCEDVLEWCVLNGELAPACFSRRRREEWELKRDGEINR